MREQGTLFSTAVLFALLTAAAEIAAKSVRVLVLHRIVWISRDVVWMTALAYLVLFVAVALLLLVIGLILRRPLPLRLVVGVPAFLMMLNWLLPFGQLASWASAILAAGVGVMVARFAAAAPQRWERLARRGALVLASVLAVAAVAVRVVRVVRERRAVAALPAGVGSQPNILFIVFDTVRRADLGLYGYPRPTTPRLEQWARDGVVFDHAIAAAPWTLPSHGSFFTGRPASLLGGNWTRAMDRGPRTLAETLRGHGYLTGAFVANLQYTDFESGLTRGFAHYDDYPVSWRLIMTHAAWGRTRLATKLADAHSLADVKQAVREFGLWRSRKPGDVYKSAQQVTDGFLDWQRSAAPRPFFAFLNYMDAHFPTAPDSWKARFRSTPHRRTDTYDAAIAWMDSEVGRLLDSLERRGTLDRTIVVLLSDHGEQFGEHGLFSHANSLYLDLLAVPLVIRYPRAVPAGLRVEPLVTLRDVPSTVLDLAGVADSGAIPGLSLTRYWRTPDTAVPSDVIAEVAKGDKVDTTFPNSKGPMVSRLDERLHYIRDGRGRESLYSWKTDSLELNDLAGDPRYQDDLRRLRSNFPDAAWR